MSSASRTPRGPRAACAWRVLIAAGFLLCPSACTGPGLDPPQNSRAHGSDATLDAGKPTGNSKGSGGASASGAGGSGASDPSQTPIVTPPQTRDAGVPELDGSDDFDDMDAGVIR